MAHLRKLIRDALMTALAAIPATGYRDRAAPLREDDLPAYRVYFFREGCALDAMRRTGGGIALSRRAQFAVHLHAAGAGVDDTLDDLAAAAEIAIAADDTLGGLVLSCLPAAAESAPPDGTGAVRIGELVLVYEVHYRTLHGAPGTAA